MLDALCRALFSNISDAERLMVRPAKRRGDDIPDVERVNRNIDSLWPRADTVSKRGRPRIGVACFISTMVEKRGAPERPRTPFGGP
jgi:hypothetical protein